jgi:hypothetical protein
MSKELWTNRHYKDFESPTEALYARIKAYELEHHFVMAHAVFMVFCLVCKQEMEAVISIPLTGVGPTGNDVYQCHGGCGMKRSPYDESSFVIHGWDAMKYQVPGMEP